MKPQTYNNFIGTQGSKPNVELIFGIVNRYGVNPMWLLNGSGAVFSDPTKSEEYLGRSPMRRARLTEDQPAVQEGLADFTPAMGPEALSALREELQALEPILTRAESQLRNAEQSQLNVLDRSIGLLRRYYEVNPAATLAALRDVLHRIEADMAGNA